MMKKEELRNIPVKNYVILGIVILVTVFILYYFYMWFDAYNESKINMPILDKYMDVINYNEIDDYIIENPDTIIYVSVLENESIREFEKEFKNSFRNKEVDNDILYLDLTNELKDKNVKSEIRDKYSFNSLSMVNVPCVVVIEDGMLKSIYGVEDNQYDVDRMVTFINNIRFDGRDIND